MTTAPHTITVQGIVLQSIDFKDYDRILTVFTETEGIVKLILKGARRQGKKSIAITPLMKGEFLYEQKGHELCVCVEATPLNFFFSLRERLASIEAAVELARLVQQSQLPGKPAPLLYKLFQYYIEKISLMPNPFLLALSFRLKILKHEGLLPSLIGEVPSLTCSLCKESCPGVFLFQGDLYCSSHAPAPSFYFSEEALHFFRTLAQCSQLSELQTLPSNKDLHSQVDRFFNSHF